LLLRDLPVGSLPIDQRVSVTLDQKSFDAADNNRMAMTWQNFLDMQSMLARAIFEDRSAAD
jgi:hypothetical protein